MKIFSANGVVSYHVQCQELRIIKCFITNNSLSLYCQLSLSGPFVAIETRGGGKPWLALNAVTMHEKCSQRIVSDIFPQLELVEFVPCVDFIALKAIKRYIHNSKCIAFYQHLSVSISSVLLLRGPSHAAFFINAKKKNNRDLLHIRLN